MPHAAYIYEALRTPRSKGKKDGTLHEVKPVDLGAGLLRALQARHDLDTVMLTMLSWGVSHRLASRARILRK